MAQSANHGRHLDEAQFLDLRLFYLGLAMPIGLALPPVGELRQTWKPLPAFKVEEMPSV